MMGRKAALKSAFVSGAIIKKSVPLQRLKITLGGASGATTIRSVAAALMHDIASGAARKRHEFGYRTTNTQSGSKFRVHAARDNVRIVIMSIGKRYARIKDSLKQRESER